MNFEEQVLRLGTVVGGTDIIREVELPLANSPGRLQPDQPELEAARGGARQTVRVGIRALTPGESEEVSAAAHREAVERGVSDPDDRNPIYSQRYNLHLCARACVDPDSPPGTTPRPFFGANVDAAIEKMRTSTLLTRDSIIFLAEHQELWQDQVSPSVGTISDEKLYQSMGEVAASKDASPFFDLRPYTRFKLTQFSASLCLRLLARSSFSDSDSVESSSSGEVGES